ncbi:class I SAM-dependent methyltransferase [Agrobacterium tumefaciens]|uniref:class I SAM-dependent methyltransferase n=1 Tax=Agrobacterium tumefaciens TaxID=358 RepID=UPI0015717E19|nr:class I SAM-dependent methyltransferase [Agrobacterium tumefaciens]
MQELTAFITDPTAKTRIDAEWDVISRDFETAYAEMPVKYMSRTELSFHPFVKLLGYLCLDVASLSGDIVEIGVWKGKSLAFMQRLSSPTTNVIGIDPFALPGQEDEVAYFHSAIFPGCFLIKNYSQNAIEQTLQISKSIKLLHIDGGHNSENVWADFLLYERFVIPGGYIVFDDYTDVAHSPEVGPAVDNIRNAGLFKKYDVIGQLPEYENSYVLKKRDND